MRPFTIRQMLTLALCAFFTANLYGAQLSNQEQAPGIQKQTKANSRFASTVEAESRDEWQKPEEVIKALNLKPGQTVVDLGAGTGYFTRRLAEALAPNGKAIALEIESSLVRALVSDARRWNLTNYEARLVPPDDPMLAPQSVDIVFLCDTYHHIDNRVVYFANIKQALRPNGRLVIIDFVKTDENPEHSIVKEEVVAELRQAGYRLVREFDFLLPKQYFLEFEPAPRQD